jgi:hypothetical protein
VSFISTILGAGTFIYAIFQNQGDRSQKGARRRKSPEDSKYSSCSTPAGRVKPEETYPGNPTPDGVWISLPYEAFAQAPTDKNREPLAPWNHKQVLQSEWYDLLRWSTNSVHENQIMIS